MNRLAEGGLVIPQDRGRQRVFHLAGPQIATLVHALAAVATRLAGKTVSEDLRIARTCYDHLAGRLGAAVARWLLQRRWIERRPGTRALRITQSGRSGLKRSFDLHL